MTKVQIPLTSNKITVAERYIEDVLSGQQLVAEFVQKTLERHVRDLETGHERGLVFDRSLALRAIRFCHRVIKHPGDSGSIHAGDPFILSPWMQAFLWILFGWRTVEGQRRFRSIYLEVARGNAKSYLLSAIGLYILVGEGVHGAEVFSVAMKKDQAKIIFDTAVEMANASPALSDLRAYQNNLHSVEMACKFMPLSSDAKSLDGLRPSAILADEIHAWVRKRSRDVWAKCKTALGKKPGSMMISGTTAGADRHSLCYEQHTYAKQVLDEVVEDDSFLSWIAALDPEKDDPFDESLWIKANPNLGVSVELQTIRDQAKQARQIPSEYNEFLRYRCNIWTERHTAWMPLKKWDSCKEPVDSEALKKRPCFAGLDLSSSNDLTALILVFPPFGDDKLWRLLPFFWLPGDSIKERVDRDNVPYDKWVRDGHIIKTDGNVIDRDAIRNRIKELAAIYDIREVCYDPWQAGELSQKLQDEDGLTVTPIRQGAQSLSAPMKRLMELVLSGQLAHGGQPVLRWNASNLVATTDSNGNIKPDKAESTERIDGMSATITALSRGIVVSIAPSTWTAEVW
jgi:phage terminase large subunit-like protein